MKTILYASTVGSLIYVMLYTSLDICIVVGMLLPLGYMDLDFQFDGDSCKSTSIFVFTLGGKALS
ncbi:hypothetical protein AAG906_016832 [Vitis piasezkii]